MRELVGQAIRRVEDPRLLRGEGRYVDDFQPAGLLHVAFLRSAYAHARLISIDAASARRQPGVAAVLTHQELADANRAMPSTTPMPAGSVLHTPTPMVADRARYAGEIVAMVLADDRYQAEDALERISVEWEPRPVVSDLAAAGDADSPLVWADAPGNAGARYRRGFGDARAAFAGVALVVRERFVIPRSSGASIEPRGVLAIPTPAAGGPGGAAPEPSLTVYDSCQAPHRVQAVLAGQLGLPAERVRVIAPEVGGGFGAKGRVYPEEVLVAAAALRLGRPVKWASTRREDLMTTGHGRGQIIESELAADADGALRGLRLRATQDAGAYIPNGVNILNQISQHAIGPYRLPALDAELIARYTHKVPLQAVRGNGRPEGVFVIERLMDRLARTLGVDPVDVRRRNLLPPDAFPHDTRLATSPSQTVVYDSGDFPTLLQQALDLARYRALRREQAERRARGELMGIGLACVIESTGVGPEGGRVKVRPDGSVEVIVGSPSQGQGHQTVFRQLAADRLGVPFERIELVQGDTGTGVIGTGTFGSRMAQSGGNAIHLAVKALHEEARRQTAELLEVAPGDLEIVDDRVQVKGSTRFGLTLQEIAARLAERDGAEGLLAGATYDVERPTTFAGGIHLAVVDVDRDTGEVTVRRYVCAHDCGRVLNPRLVDGQVQGGLAHGLGNVLMEFNAHDAEGQLLTATFLDYALPTAERVPNAETTHLETRSPYNPEGIKGAGEGGTIGAFPAIANAVEDAIWSLGGRVTELPLTAERVRRSMEGGGGGGT